MIPLTNRQITTFAAILIHFKHKGRWPTYRALMKMLDAKSPNGVRGLLDKLREAGYIEPGERQAASIRPTKEAMERMAKSA